MRKFKHYYCNESECWKDELTVEDLEECANEGNCSACECGTGFDNKEARGIDG